MQNYNELRTTWNKPIKIILIIITSLILTYLSGYILNPFVHNSGYMKFQLGLPIPYKIIEIYYTIWGPAWNESFNYLMFLLDVILWLVILEILYSLHRLFIKKLEKIKKAPLKLAELSIYIVWFSAIAFSTIIHESAHFIFALLHPRMSAFGIGLFPPFTNASINLNNPDEVIPFFLAGFTTEIIIAIIFLTYFLKSKSVHNTDEIHSDEVNEINNIHINKNTTEFKNAIKIFMSAVFTSQFADVGIRLLLPLNSSDDVVRIINGLELIGISKTIGYVTSIIFGGILFYTYIWLVYGKKIYFFSSLEYKSPGIRLIPIIILIPFILHRIYGSSNYELTLIIALLAVIACAVLQLKGISRKNSLSLNNENKIKIKIKRAKEIYFEMIISIIWLTPFIFGFHLYTNPVYIKLFQYF